VDGVLQFFFLPLGIVGIGAKTLAFLGTLGLAGRSLSPKGSDRPHVSPAAGIGTLGPSSGTDAGNLRPPLGAVFFLFLHFINFRAHQPYVIVHNSIRLF
jgi:hypothetical protein